MDGKFIYVFDDVPRDKLLAQGYFLLKADDKQKIYIFENTPNLSFTTDDFSFIVSNTLTF